MKRVFESDVLDPDPFNRLESPVVLADAPKGDSKTVVQLAVCERDIRTVGLQRETVVAIIHRPVVKRNVRRPDCVSTVGIRYGDSAEYNGHAFLQGNKEAYTHS